MEKEKKRREKRNREQETENTKQFKQNWEKAAWNREKGIPNIKFQRSKKREREYSAGERKEGKEQRYLEKEKK